MTTLFTAIFYLWLVLTILLAAMWFLREQDRRRKDRQENQLEDELLSNNPNAGETSGGDNQGADVPIQPLPWSKTAKNKQKSKNSQRKRSKGTAKSAEPVVALVEDAPAEGKLAEETPAEELVEEERQEAQAGETPSDEPDGPKLPGVVDLLDGVTLPFDLTPLTARIEDPNHHAIFISPHPDAAEVGTAFADELVQQGFEIEAAGFDQAIATRGTDTLLMRISPDAGTVTDGSDRRYPSANENDVAIEIWTGNGSPPPLSN